MVVVGCVRGKLFEVVDCAQLQQHRGWPVVVVLHVTALAFGVPMDEAALFRIYIGRADFQL